MGKVVIFGTSSLSVVIRCYISSHSSHKVVAHTVDRAYMKGKEFRDLPLVPFETIDKVYPPSEYSMLVVIGYQGVNKLRSQKYNEAKEKGYRLISYIDKRSAIEKGVEIGENCVIASNQSIEPLVKIGNDVIIRPGCYIGHNVIIGDHCFIASQVAISGDAIIEPYTFLGINSTIRNGVKIGKGCVIGAGALILKDTGEYEVYKGIKGELLSRKSFEINV